MHRSPVSYYRIWLAYHCLLFVVLSQMLNRSMFSGGRSDGFYVQIQETKQVSIVFDNPNLFIHYLRYITVYPFDFIVSNNLDPAFEAAVMVLALLPILLVRFANGYRHAAQPLLVYLPLMVSYRSALVACAIGYLFIFLFIQRNRYGLLFISAVFANLSSGVVIIWLAIMAYNSRATIRRRKWLTVVFALMVGNFALQFVQKLDFFSAQAGAESSGLVHGITRNTLVTTITTGQWARAVFYLTLLALVAFILIVGRSVGLTRPARAFYFFALPSFLFEGLGPLSYIVPITWFFLYVARGRAPESVQVLRPSSSVAAATRAHPGLAPDAAQVTSSRGRESPPTFDWSS